MLKGCIIKIMAAVMILPLAIVSCKETKSKDVAPVMAKDVIKTGSGEITIVPVSHASIVIKTKNTTIYVDPVGDKNEFAAYPGPDLILITHNHGDHMNVDLIKDLKVGKTIIAGPKSLVEKYKGAQLIVNGDTKKFAGINITAVPMYNTSSDRLKFHPKGAGNGYLLNIDDKKIYISGDTEDIPEMRSLKNIDAAFICINLPYTMTEEQAASAVLEFKPKVVYPYHYRGADKKFSDLDKFKKLVGSDKNIEVKLLKWY